MALNPPFTVRVEKPEMMLANTMIEMRSWLDNHRVKPVEFKIAMAGMPGIVFAIRFRREEEETLFERAFS